MSDVLEKIRKLMALALNNPSGEEARSAALKAVQLLRDHDVVLALPAPGPRAPIGVEFDDEDLGRAMWQRATREPQAQVAHWCGVCSSFHSPTESWSCFVARWAHGGQR